MNGGDDIRVRPEDLKEAGETAITIGGELMASHHRNDVQRPAEAVSGALAGFALAEAHKVCANAWDEELGALGSNIREAGTGLRDNANNYDMADALGSEGFDSLGSMLGE